jgi:hypothetical protein
VTITQDSGPHPGPMKFFASRAGKEGRLGSGAPPFAAASRRSSGKRRLANRKHQVMPYLSGKHIVLLMQPGKLGFEIAYSLLQAAHL